MGQFTRGYPHFRKPQKPHLCTFFPSQLPRSCPGHGRSRRCAACVLFGFFEPWPRELGKKCGIFNGLLHKGNLHETIDVSITVNIWVVLFFCSLKPIHWYFLLQQTRWCMMFFWMGKFNDSTIFLMGNSGAFFIKPSNWGSWNGHWMMVWGVFFAFLCRNHIQLHAYVYIYNWEYSQCVWAYVGYATITIYFYIPITYIWEYSHYIIGNIMVIHQQKGGRCGDYNPPQRRYV